MPPALRFGISLLAQLAREKRETNTLISPVSVGSVLAMAARGARGPLQESILRVISGPDNPSDTYSELLGQISGREGVTLLIANSIWANQDFRLRQEYVDFCRESYQAEADSVDFSDPATAKRINSWVREKTREKIGGILDSTDPNIAVVLLNATYFFGRWADEFDSRRTQDLPFHAPSGTHPHPMMTRGGSFLYREDPGFQAVGLSYAQNDAAMYFYLPGRLQGLRHLIDRFEVDPAECMSGFEMRAGSVTLPRFRCQCALELTPTLRAMGLSDLFTAPTCDLSDMFLDEVPAFVSSVRHKVLVDVNEIGTEAAAVTGQIMFGCALVLSEPFHMILDRPFLFTVCDTRTGTLLFAGAVYDPAR